VSVGFNEFKKLDIRVGKVVKAEMVPNAKKLIKLQIDIGGKTKQSIAGLGEHYTPQDLLSKTVVVVTNLEVKKIFNLDSEVMLLAAVDGDKVSLLQPDKQVKEGASVT
jgi:methionine--tRNA ligase beta chain